MDELVGKVVDAIVTHVVEYGVWVTHLDRKLLVLIVDVADEPIRDLRLRYEREQHVRVRIERYVPEPDAYRAVIRGVDQV